MALALAEYEASLNSLGFPRDEATSKDADPNNPRAKWVYKADSLVDWSLQAEAEYLKERGSDDPYSRSRVVRVSRVARGKTRAVAEANAVDEYADPDSADQ